MKTANALYECYEQGGCMTPAMMMDLCGVLNWPAHIRNDSLLRLERMQLFDGLYRGLWLMNVPWEEIELHRAGNSLDTLIHSTYLASGKHSGYYADYCSQHVTIGDTHYK